MLNLEANSFFPSGNLPNDQAMGRWDHGGFEQLQQEDQGTWHKIRNPKKQKAAVEGDYKRTTQKNNSNKWMNNKQDDLSTRVSQNEAKGHSKANKKERKPDRQLYSVRDKRADNQGQNTTQTRNNAGKPKMGNPFVPPFDVAKETEGLVFEDDKSFVSNVSTAISERLKNIDEERDENKERLMLTSNDQSQTTSPEGPNVLFSLCLGAEDNYETVFIYEGEQDYESFLDQVCLRHEIVDRNALYFKINLLQMIVNAHSNPSSVEPVLNKLLDQNYNLLLSEVEAEMDEASPLFYGESNDSFTDNTLEDSC